MNDLAIAQTHLPAASDEAISKVSMLAEEARKRPHVDIETYHLLHGGIYARSLVLPKGVLLTGVLIKVPTTLVTVGDVIAYVDGVGVRLSGYKVMAGSARRKQAFYAMTDTLMTMQFRTDAKTIKEAEDQFTDEARLLMSRRDDAVNHVTITGE
jgi:hypothetical protein